MKRRMVALLAAALMMVGAMAVPALAAKPTDDPAQGCENANAKPLEGYCETNP